MIKYHGTPITPESAAAEILRGRSMMVSFARPEQLEELSAVVENFVLDNGAFTAWKQGVSFDWNEYYRWVWEWHRHPAFQWAIIPDVIAGSEEENNELVEEWSAMFPLDRIVPVYHLHESLDRLVDLSWRFGRVALGSSGQYAQIKTGLWWNRMYEIMNLICYDQGFPRCRLHGLRMLDPEVFTRFPFASADSCNIGLNIGKDKKWTGSYIPLRKATRGVVMADNIEFYQSPAQWQADLIQESLELPTEPLFAHL